MRGGFRRAGSILLLLGCGGLAAFAQQIKEMQFVNQPVNDILLALGEVSGKSIIPDETVGGTASYHFTATDFDTALQVFLSTYKMYVRKQDSVYYVSRIRVDADPAAGLISMDAEDVEIHYLIRAASKALGRTILFDPLPGQPLTVHVTRMSPDKLLEIIVKRFPDYKVEVDQDFFYVKRIPTTPTSAAAGRPAAPGGLVERVGAQYSLRVEKSRFVDVLDALFTKAKLEYSLLSKKDLILDKMRFEAKPFERILRLLLEQANADYALIGDVYYIFEIESRDVLKKLNTTVRIPLTYLSAKELPNLFPAELLSAQLFRIDAARNAVILSGSVEEIGPAQEFLRKVDQPLADRNYQLFRLSYLNAAKIAAILPPEFRHIEPVIIPESNSFVALMSEDSRKAFADYLALVDRPTASTSVKLKYLKAEDLLKKLPPSIAKEEILETGDPSVVFVRASADKLEDFYRELKILDKPVPQIRYQFLVIQYNKGESLDWSDSVSAKPTTAGPGNAFLGTLGNLLDLNFDIVSTFGLQFAVKLNSLLTTKDAQVRADTALVGLSGQDLEFRNTETFRYQEAEVDEKGNTIFTGVTREITSGLIFKIQGWVSGDQMITMNVKATVSKRGAAAATSSGAPGIPTTSENIVNTLARTTSGQPVVIGGLMRQETDIQVSKVPVLGHIPVLGYLFQSRKETLENSEMVIYILPRVEYGEVEEADPALTLERLYQRFFKS
jgi:type II secretory pathway component GspD/PulD (secretin)